jgi:diguanylate cyclase (GGDEF)-like protein
MLLELQNAVLKMIARGESLHATMDRLCREVEAMAPGALCSLLALDEHGILHPLAGPSLPPEYSAAIDGVAAGPNIGSCGTAAFLGEAVAVTDIETDLRWVDFKHLPLPLGLLACWSSPIFDKGGRVIGTFAFYFTERRGPTNFERALVEASLPVCTIAMELHERLLQHERQSRTDALTGLPNRAGFDHDIDGRMPAAWAMLLIDVDHLKTVNDTFGHLTGDALIRVVASRLSQSAHPHQTYRLGGDEFAVIVDSSEPEELRIVAEEISADVKAAADCNGHVILPTVTIGGAVHAGASAEATRQNADFALYHAKETCRGSIVLHNRALGTAISERVDAVRMVALALEENRIEAHYQPIVRLDTREIVGVEALCRVRAPDGTIIPAADFHEATKDARVAGVLTRRMVAQVARDVGRWLSMGIPFQHVGINVSAADFQAGGLSDLLRHEFSTSRVDLKHAILEVTESVYLGHRDQPVASEIRALREAGLKVALDDFGTGFASLTHLLTVPVDIIKIDRSFVARLSHGDVGAAVVEGILHIARNLGMRVVAEGIETVDQAETLREMGCVLGQGFLYSRPVPADRMTRQLLEGAQGMGSSLRAIA